jgi:predicted DNA-binding transcriptional regulator YafY
MNRTDRLVSLVMLLQSRRVITAAEMARHFEITERTVYRDLAALGEGGVPIVGEPGVGYSLMKGYQLPPVMFTPQEALALVTSSSLAEGMTDHSVRSPMRSALAKLTALLPAEQQSQAQALQKAIAVQQQKEKRPPVPLSTLQAATVERRVLRLKYHGLQRQQPTQRDVEPLGLTFYAQQWHLIAWCRLRNEVRDFRHDRILSCAPTAEQSPRRADFDLHDYLTKCHRSEIGATVVLRVHRSIADVLRRAWGPLVEEVLLEGDWLTFSLRIGEMDYIARWLVGFGQMVTVLEPDALRHQVIAAAQAAIRHHQAAKKGNHP